MEISIDSMKPPQPYTFCIRETLFPLPTYNNTIFIETHKIITSMSNDKIL